MTDIGTLTTRLSTERFDGGNVPWQAASWGGTNLDLASNATTHFYLHNGRIYAQSKAATDPRLSCFDCGGDARAHQVSSSEWYRNGPGVCAGSGRTQTNYVPYCPKCDPIPTSVGIVLLDLPVQTE